jgi:hypothetical protein
MKVRQGDREKRKCVWVGVRDNTFKDWGSNPSGKVRLREDNAFGSGKGKGVTGGLRYERRKKDERGLYCTRS